MPTLNPKATAKLLDTWDIKNGAPRGHIKPRVIVLHTNASGSPMTIQGFWNSSNSGGAQPHFQASGGFDKSGDTQIWQLLPTDREGVCSWSADPFCISIETQDAGAIPIEKLRTQPWTPTQFENIAQVCAVECARWGIPVRLCDAWNGSGIGYHSMWGVNQRQAAYKGEPPNPPAYPNPWTLTVGKTCPEQARIAQMPALIARIAQILGTQPLPDGDTMVLIKGNSVNTSNQVFPYKGNGDATWLPVVLPNVGYCLAHVDDGTFRDVMASAGELRVCDQVAVDAAKHVTAQDYRNFLAACSAPSAPPPDLSQVATKADVAAVPGKTVDAVSEALDNIVITPPAPAPLNLTLAGTVDLNEQAITLSGQGVPVPEAG